jgi:hypothetical protein
MNDSARRRSTPGRLAVWLCAAVCSQAWVVPARAQEDAIPFGQGTHALRHILHDLGLQPIEEVKELTREPEKKLLIVLGDTRVLHRIPFGVELFVHRGGAVLVASDRRTESWLWQDNEGFRIGDRLEIAEDSPSAWRNHRACIAVQPAERGVPRLFPASGTSRVVTNRPANLFLYPRGIPILGLLPEGSRAERGNFIALGSQVPFAAGGDWHAGRILVLADHSIFINDMMLQPDTGNIEFAHNAIRWLTDGGKRTQVLFVEERAVQSEFDVPVKDLPPPPLPPAEVLVPLIDEVIKNLEEENAFNQVALNLFDRVLARYFAPFLSPGQFLEALALLGTVGLVMYGVSRLMSSRHRLEAGTPLLANALARLAPVGGVVAQRQQALLESGNLWESARVLARECFESALGGGPSGDGMASAAPPRIRVVGSRWQAWRLQRSWDRLWHVAYGTTPTRVASREWTRFLRSLDEVDAGLADGVIQLERPGDA